MKTQSKVLLGVEAAIFFIIAIAAIAWPGITDILLVYFAGAALLVSGIAALIQSFGLKGVPGRGVIIFSGILGVILGLVLLFANPITGTLILVYTLLFWFIMTSITQIVVASQIKGGWAVFSIILNVIVILLSIWGFFDVTFALGVYFWTIALAFMFLAVSKLMQIFIPQAPSV
ncbi:DUF308 domain-containing protein [Culicoidibacter larvae]|uniref:HdeD family acid-resistance protein n=1 Tax=Culicoidibacter larvae TaxID=2579976 RepID=A0A5R8QAM3_9FIRM|nr:DUF308 domain-containing protein [Culicoidibacter larvae]TLG72930.1 hypothetical protein FEZ08_07740 [Culicoidibacter larvae]